MADASITYGADCTHWDDREDRFCGQRALFYRRDREQGLVVAVVCGLHMRHGDDPIPPDAERAAPATFLRDKRFTH